MVRRALFLAFVVVTACSDDAGEDDAGDDAPPGSTDVALAGVRTGVLLDDLRFSAPSRTILAAPGGSRHVFRFAVDPEVVTVFDPFGAAAASVDEGNGLLFVADRAAKILHVVDVATRATVSDVPLDTTPDYVRFSATTNEVWVTEPAGKQIEVFHFPHAGSPLLARRGFVDVGDGPEGLVFDARRNRAYVHLYSPNIGVIDLTSRLRVASWPTRCTASHGIPHVDEARGFVFAGCRGKAHVTVLAADRDGAIVGEFELGSGDTALAYAPELGHFYLRGDPGPPIAVLGIQPDGRPVELGRFEAAQAGHVMAADDRGQLWAADPAAGRLLRFKDPFPATR
jgi:hypothetical protein